MNKAKTGYWTLINQKNNRGAFHCFIIWFLAVLLFGAGCVTRTVPPAPSTQVDQPRIMPPLPSSAQRSAPAFALVPNPGTLLARSAPPDLITNETVALLWDASPDASVTGYALYYALVDSAVATNRLDVGPVLSCTVSNLTRGPTYWFFVVAYNAAGTESLPSNTLLYTPSGPPPTDSFTISVQESTSPEGPWVLSSLWMPVTIPNPATTNSPDAVRFYRLDIKKNEP